MNPLYTLIKKELRENALWAALMGVVLFLAMAESIKIWGINPNPILGSAFNLLLTFGLPLVATALGLLLTYFESRGDKWAFLVHRPVSPSLLFASKLLAGVALYAVAALLPLALALGYAALPGTLPIPFLWPMALPAVAMALGASLFLPAAMAIPFTRNRSNLARVFPLGLPILACLLVPKAFEFSHAVLILTPFVPLTLLIAHQAFAQNLASPGTASSIPRRLGHASAHLSALVLCCLIAGVLVWGIATVLRQRPHYISRDYMLDNQGRVVMYVTDGDQPSRFTDTDGNPLATTPGTSETPASTWTSLRPAFVTRLDSSINEYRDEIWDLQAPYTDSYRYAIRIPTLYNSFDSWYYIASTGRIEGNSHQGNLYAGCFGPDGFDGPQEPQRRGFSDIPLSVSANNSQTLVRHFYRSEAIQLLDVGHHTLKTVFTPRGNESILAVGQVSSGPPDYNILLQAAFITNQRFVVFDTVANTILWEIPIHTPLPEAFTHRDTRRREVNIAKTGNTLTLLIRPPGHGETPADLLFVSIDTTSGKVLQTQSLPAIQREQMWLVNQEKYAAMLLGPSVSSVIHQEWLGLGYPLAYIRPPAPLWLLASSAAGFGVCLVIGLVRRFPLGHLLSWALVGAVIGLPAALVMAVILRPLTQRCPACARVCAIDQPACPRCHTAAAPPPRTGFELLEPLPAPSTPQP